MPRSSDIGLSIFSAWVFPFEVASMLLLGALVGAILMSRRQSGESGEETAITAIDVGDPGFEDQPELRTTPRTSEAIPASTGGDQ